MTLRIEMALDGHTATLRIIGRAESDTWTNYGPNSESTARSSCSTWMK